MLNFRINQVVMPLGQALKNGQKVLNTSLR